MAEPEPTSDPLPRASRVVPKTVRVRRADYDHDPDDEPTYPPKVLFWFRLACVPVALIGIFLTAAAVWLLLSEGVMWERLALLAGGLVVFIAYTLPLWWRRPRRWHWIYGLIVLLPGVLPFTNPLAIVLLVFWCRPRAVNYFRTPPNSYTVTPPADDTTGTSAQSPAALFALRWMCMLGCGACLLAMPIVAAVVAIDPNGGWGAIPWLGVLTVALGLLVVPLFARTPRPWVWWYALGLLVISSLSGYLTLLAVPVLIGWLLKGTRGWFGLGGGPVFAASVRADQPNHPHARGEEPAV